MPTLDFVADILCPWCFIARRRMEEALEQLRPRGLSIEWVWRPFLLEPDGPTRGRDADAHWQSRFGSLAASDRYHAGVAEAGHAVNIAFRYERIRRIPHARDAHRLILLAQEHGLQARICEVLATAFFSRGLDIGDAEVLIELAGEGGLPGGAAHDLLTGSKYALEIAQSDERAKHNGIQAVPVFCLYGKILQVRRLDAIADALLAADRSLGRGQSSRVRARSLDPDS